MRKFQSIAVAILVLTSMFACSKQDRSGWFLDSSFTDLLVSFREDKPIITKDDPATAVDVLQIFRTPKGRDALFTVDEIRSQELDYETTNPKDILSLVRAARTVSKDTCEITESEFVFFILAFDRDLMRVAFIKFFPCRRDDLGYYQKWGTNSIYFSSELAKFMNKIVPPRLQRRQTKG
jgi:hypothetical protein